MDADDADRLARLERQVQFLLQRAGVDPDVAASNDVVFDPSLPVASAAGSRPVSPEIVALAARKPIQAIKLYRDMTGAGLKEAKDVIDALRAGRLP